MGIRSLVRRNIAALVESRSAENPAMALNPALVWLNQGAPTAAGEVINEHSSLQITTVYACVRVLAESIASLPLKVYERLDRGRREAAEHWLYNLLVYAPNSEMSAFTFWETLVGSLALSGNCYVEIQRSSATNQPIALWPLHCLKTEPIRTPNGDLAYRTSDGMKGATRIIASADVLHIPLFCFDGLKGFSPIQMARQSLGLYAAAEKFGARFFGNGSRPGGVMTQETGGVKLDNEQISRLKESWEATQGGVNQGRTAFIPGSWKYTPVGLSPEDSQFLSTRKFGIAEIAALFRIAPHMVGDTSRLSNNNHEQQSLQFVTDTLRPYLSRIEREVIRKLIPTRGQNAGKYFVEFDLRERLRGDFASQMSGYAIGKQWGFFNTNYVLEALGENPIGPEGDVYWAPVNMVNAEALLKLPEPAGAGDPVDDGKPTPQERNLLDRYTAAYISTFRHATGLIAGSSKRDFPAIAQAFGPIIESLVGMVKGHYDLPADAEGRIVRDSLKSLEKRAGNWSPATANTNAMSELVKAIRSAVIGVHRELGAQAAIKQLEGGNDEEA